MDRPRPMDRDDEAKLDLSSAKLGLASYKPFRPQSSSVEAEFGAVTHTGLRRTTSDDHFLIVRLGRNQETIASSLPAGAVPDRFDERGFGMVIADGMGPDGPEIASRLAISTLAQLVLRYGKWNVRVNEQTAWEIVQRAERFYRRVGEEVTEASQQHPALFGMGSDADGGLQRGRRAVCRARRTLSGLPLSRRPPDTPDQGSDDRAAAGGNRTGRSHRARRATTSVMC